MITKNISGFSLVELILTMGLMAVFLPALVSGLAVARSGKAQEAQRLGALGLLKESEEAVRVARNNDWSNVQDGTFHPTISGNTWILNSGSELVNGYTRSVVISDVYRDGLGAISATGPLDPSTKKVDLQVSWTTPIQSHVDSTFYLTRFQSNDALSGSGTIQPLSGNGNWCTPSLSVTYVDMSGQGVPNAVAAIPGQVFAATGNNASGVSFADIAVTNPPSPIPPVASLNGTFDGYKTNGVFGETNYAYLATDKKIVILDLSKIVGGKYVPSGYFDLGNKKHDTIAVTGNLGFTSVGNTLYSFDLSNKNIIVSSALSSVNMSSSAKKIIAINGFLYVALDSNTTQLKIYSYSPDGKTLTFVDQISVSGSNGRDVFVNATSTRAYLVSATSSTQKEFFIINIDKASVDYKKTYGTYDTSGTNPTGVTIVTPQKAIIVGTGGLEYQVVDINDEMSLPSTPCGTLNIDTGINGVSSILTSNPSRAYSYIITAVHAKELQIIEGGSGNGGGTGMFESNTFDEGRDVAFNNFTATSDPNLTYKFSIKHGISGNCSSVAFSDSDYAQFPQGALPLSNIGMGYTNPGQCLRYRVLSSSSSPINYSLNINYSP